MKIKYEHVLNGMTRAEAYEIEYNTIGAFQNRDSNTPGYHIVQLTGNAYTLQKQHTCHAFNPPVKFPEGELVWLAKFMNPIRKSYYWYHKPDELIPAMVNLKKVVIPFI